MNIVQTARRGASPIAAVALLGALALGGCVAAIPKYVSLDPALPGAELTFAKGYRSGFGVSGSAAYDISTDPQGCTSPHNVTRLLWTTPDTKTVRVAAERRIVVTAASIYYYTESVTSYGYGPVANLGTLACVGAGSFTPVAGEAYDVKLEHPFGGGCRLHVVNRGTGQPPSDLKLDPTARCVGLAD